MLVTIGQLHGLIAKRRDKIGCYGGTDCVDCAKNLARMKRKNGYSHGACEPTVPQPGYFL